MGERKVFMVRHQAGGLITSHVFAAQPTDAQIAPIRAECERLHGPAEKKTGEPWWLRVVEVPLLGNEVPKFPEREPAGGPKRNAADLMGATVSGVGSVVNPAGK